MIGKPPIAIFVIAILNLIIGTFGVFWDGAGTLTVLAENGLGQRYLGAAHREAQLQVAAELTDVPFFRTYQLVATVGVPWLLTMLLLASGLGLIWLRPWGRVLAVGYALLSIGHKVVVAVYTFAFLLPFYQAVFRGPAVPDPDAGEAGRAMAALAVVLVPFVMAIYPVAVLVVLNQLRAVVALQSQPTPAMQPA